MKDDKRLKKYYTFLMPKTVICFFRKNKRPSPHLYGLRVDVKYRGLSMSKRVTMTILWEVRVK